MGLFSTANNNTLITDDLDSGIFYSTTPSAIGGSNWSGAYSIASQSAGYPWNGTITASGITSGSVSTSLSVNGDADIKGNLTVQGVSLTDRISKIEQRLAILHPNKELEERWENLRALGQMYRELEAEILEKEELYKILKK